MFSVEVLHILCGLETVVSHVMRYACCVPRYVALATLEDARTTLPTSVLEDHLLHSGELSFGFLFESC